MQFQNAETSATFEMQHPERHVSLQKGLRELSEYDTVLIRNSSWTHSHRLHASLTLCRKLVNVIPQTGSA
jgi:hypothetical protein